MPALATLVDSATSSLVSIIRPWTTRAGHAERHLSEFDFRALGDGRSASARYANNSNYRNDSLIRKESGLLTLSIIQVVSNELPVCVSSLMIDEIKRMIKESEIVKYELPLL